MKLNSNKILLRLVTQNNTKHNYKVFGLDASYKGWELVYWNFLPLADKKLNKAYTKEGHRIKKHRNWININSLRNLKDEIRKMPKNFYYVDGTSNFFINIFLDRVLSILGGERIIIHSGADWDGKGYHLKKSFNTIFFKNKIFLLEKIFYYFVYSFKNFITEILRTKPKIFFAGNHKTYTNFKKIYKKQKIYKIDSPEFTNFLDLKNKKNKKNKRTKNILYLDQDLPQPYDFKLTGSTTSLLTKKVFWDHLDKIFYLFDKKFRNFNLTIAASPRRNTNDIPIKRKFFFDQTPNLIRNSDLILAHHSLAIKYAVLFRKPIVFLSVDLLKLESQTYEEVLKFYAKELGSKIITINSFILNSDNKINMKLFFKINEKKYKKFESTYIGFPGLKSQGRWKVILKHLDNNKFN